MQLTGLEEHVHISILMCYIVLTEKRRDSNASTVSTEKRLAVEKPTVTIPEPRPLSASSGSVPATPIPATTPNVSYNLGHIGAGGNAIAAAASQAIAATQQVQAVMEVTSFIFTVRHGIMTQRVETVWCFLQNENDLKNTFY